MKSLTETYTPLIKDLQDLNQEIRRKLSFMHSYTEQEMRSLEQWLEEAEKLVVNLEGISSIISHHLTTLRTEYLSQLREDSSKG